MKLLSKTSISYLWVSFSVLVITGVLLYMLLRKLVTDEIREQLELQTETIAESLKQGQKINYPLVELTKASSANAIAPPIFRDTLIYDFIQQEEEGYFFLRETKNINQQRYSITVMTAEIGWEGYSKAILFIFLIMACLLVLIGALVNYFINKKLWEPFFQNLNLLKTYSVSSPSTLQLVPSSIDEFQELNRVAADLAKRSREEYKGLKEFTENASHETQTPLAIIRSRLDRISQSPIDEVTAGYILDASQAVERLSKLNKGLLLLAKLDNNAFPDLMQIDITTTLEAMLYQMEDLFQQRGMQIDRCLQHKNVEASPYLLDILFGNLLSNILQHGKPGSQIRIAIDPYKMSFYNPGEPINLPIEKLFQRFGTHARGNDGNGLGLAIIKEICAVHQWTISYSYQEKGHVFEITF